MNLFYKELALVTLFWSHSKSCFVWLFKKGNGYRTACRSL